MGPSAVRPAAVMVPTLAEPASPCACTGLCVRLQSIHGLRVRFLSTRLWGGPAKRNNTAANIPVPTRDHNAWNFQLW